MLTSLLQQPTTDVFVIYDVPMNNFPAVPWAVIYIFKWINYTMPSYCCC